MNRKYWRQFCSMERVADLDNLFAAARTARQGKSRRPDVEAWWRRVESEVPALRHELLTGEYRPGPYREFVIHEPKRRIISAAPFRDRVVHHALCRWLAPVLQHRFIARSFSCQVGKGTMAARECCRQLTNRWRYVLKCDVQKFFPSIDHAILHERLAWWVNCPAVQGLIGRIIASYVTGDGIPRPVFPGDDLVAVTLRPRGLPIGNLTSQLWGNFYLDDLDHWVTETEGHGAYLRYTDDFMLFGDEKTRLWELHAGIEARLAGLRLKLAASKTRILRTDEEVPFCGFRFHAGLRPRVLGPTKRRFEQRRYALHRQTENRQTLSRAVFQWYQFSREANSVGLRRAYSKWSLDSRLKRRRRRTRRFAGRVVDQ